MLTVRTVAEALIGTGLLLMAGCGKPLPPEPSATTGSAIAPITGGWFLGWRPGDGAPPYEFPVAYAMYGWDRHALPAGTRQWWTTTFGPVSEDDLTQLVTHYAEWIERSEDGAAILPHGAFLGEFPTWIPGEMDPSSEDFQLVLDALWDLGLRRFLVAPWSFFDYRSPVPWSLDEEVRRYEEALDRLPRRPGLEWTVTWQSANHVPWAAKGEQLSQLAQRVDAAHRARGLRSTAQFELLRTRPFDSEEQIPETDCEHIARLTRAGFESVSFFSQGLYEGGEREALRACPDLLFGRVPP